MFKCFYETVSLWLEWCCCMRICTLKSFTSSCNTLNPQKTSPVCTLIVDIPSRVLYFHLGWDVPPLGRLPPRVSIHYHEVVPPQREGLYTSPHDPRSEIPPSPAQKVLVTSAPVLRHKLNTYGILWSRKDFVWKWKQIIFRANLTIFRLEQKQCWLHTAGHACNLPEESACTRQCFCFSRYIG